MDIARHVFSTYFKDTTNPLVRHHLDSFSDLLTTKIPNFIKGSNPQRLVADDNRTIDVYIGGKNGDKISYKPPTEESDDIAVKDDTWNDLGVDSFLNENSSNSGSNPNNFTAVAPSQPVASTLHQTQPTISQP
jgi:hypothetical protein